jgi:hypothetical protein
MTVDLNEDAIKACADLVGRMGAREFHIGHVREGVPVDEAGWFAHALFRGGEKIGVDEHLGPTEAADALCERLMTGAQCLACKSVVQFRDEGAVVYEKSTLLDGRRWDAEDAKRAGLCRWRRIGPKWVRGCEPDGIVAEIEHVVRDGDVDEVAGRLVELIFKLALLDRDRARKVYATIEAGIVSGLKLGRQQRRNLARQIAEDQPDG